MENDINAFDKEGLTPLLRACRYGETEDVRRLLTHTDIDVNKADCIGMTPLHWAAFKGRQVIVEMLLAVDDIDVAKVDIHGQPIIRFAAYNGHVKVAKMLASHGACHYNHTFGHEVIPALGAKTKETAKAIHDGNQRYNSKMRSAILFMLCFLRAEDPKNKEHHESNLSLFNRDVAYIILQYVTGYKTKVFLKKLRQFPIIFSHFSSKNSRKRKRSGLHHDEETHKSDTTLSCQR